ARPLARPARSGLPEAPGVPGCAEPAGSAGAVVAGVDVRTGAAVDGADGPSGDDGADGGAVRVVVAVGTWTSLRDRTAVDARGRCALVRSGSFRSPGEKGSSSLPNRTTSHSEEISGSVSRTTWPV